MQSHAIVVEANTTLAFVPEQHEEMFAQNTADLMTEAELEAATRPEALFSHPPVVPTPAEVVNIDKKGEEVIDDKPGVGGEQANILEEKAPAEAPKPDAAWLKDGLACGEIFKKSELTRKLTTLEFAAKYFANDAATEDFLRGFKEAMGVSTSTAQTVSKIRSVFLAYGKKSHERVVGSDPVTKEPIKATKSGEQWLLECQDGWEKFCTLAREIRGPIGKNPSGPGVKSSISKEEVEKVEGQIKLANPEQTSKIIAGAMDRVETRKDWEPILVILMFEICSRLSDSENLVYQKLAEEVRGMLNDFDNARLGILKVGKAIKTVEPVPAVPANVPEQNPAPIEPAAQPAPIPA